MEIAEIAPLLRADKITLTISAEKNGNIPCDIWPVGLREGCVFRVSPLR